MDISHFIEGNIFELNSTTANISYRNLVFYLSPSPNYKSRALSKHISDILDKYKNFPLNRIVKFYPYLTIGTQKKFQQCIKESIEKTFDIELFSVLLKPRITKKLISILKNHLYDVIDSAKTSSNIITYPKTEPYQSLLTVGYLCLKGILDRNDFMEFLGIHTQFDFFINPNDFDYTQFDFTWLFDLNKAALNAIASYKVAKEKIHKCIALKIKENKINKLEEDRLTKILFGYFT